MGKATDIRVTEEDVRELFACQIRGNHLYIVNRQNRRTILCVMIQPQCDQVLTNRFYMDLAKRTLKYIREAYMDVYPPTGR